MHIQFKNISIATNQRRRSIFIITTLAQQLKAFQCNVGRFQMSNTSSNICKNMTKQQSSFSKNVTK